MGSAIRSGSGRTSRRGPRARPGSACPLPLARRRPATAAGLGALTICVAVIAAALVLRPSPGPAADEPIRASKEDATLRLSLRTPHGIYRPDDAIEPLATISYLGPTAETMIYTGDPAVVFAIQELGGGRRMDWSQNLPCLNTIVDQAEPLTFPFAKSGVMTSFDAAWYADPVLRLPVGIWRIRAVLDAETTNGAGGCGGVPHRFEVDNVIQVVDEPTP